MLSSLGQVGEESLERARSRVGDGHGTEATRSPPVDNHQGSGSSPKSDPSALRINNMMWIS